MLIDEELIRNTYDYYLQDTERTDVHNEWMDGVVPVVAATLAFGMGIDKQCVRFVAHWSVPQSVAEYYQESGRAGRDAKASYARIFYSKKDRDTRITHLMQDQIKAKTEISRNTKEAVVDSFKIMVKYCESDNCRHAVISKFFGDNRPNCVKNCDVCFDKQSVQERLEIFKVIGTQSDQERNMDVNNDSAKLELMNVVKEKFFCKN